MTMQAGLVLFEEFLGVLPSPKRSTGPSGARGAGYPASSYVLSLLLMLQRGGGARKTFG